MLKIHEIRQKQKKKKSEVREYAVLNTSHETFSQYHTPQGDLKKSKPEKNDYLNEKKKEKRSTFIQLVGQFNCTKCLISILKALPLK